MSKIRLSGDGVALPARMQAYTSLKADSVPRKKLLLLRKLLDTKRPKLCVIRGEGIGDVLMITPAIHALRALYDGNVDITFATNTKYLDQALVKVVAGNPDITNVIDRDNIDESDYNAVLNLHCPAIYHERPMAPPVNRIDLFARHLGFSTPLKDPLPRMFLTKQELDTGETYLFNSGLSGKKVCIVNLFASSLNRSIETGVIRGVLHKLYDQHRVHSLIVTHSNSDPRMNLEWSNIPGSMRLANKDVRQLASIMVHSNLLLCPDSALLHVAGALGVPTASIFAPTDPRARVNYYPRATAVWGGEGLGGHPHWYEPCPGRNVCWNMVTEENVLKACVQQLQVPKANIQFILNRASTPLARTELM